MPETPPHEEPAGAGPADETARPSWLDPADGPAERTPPRPGDPDLDPDAEPDDPDEPPHLERGSPHPNEPSPEPDRPVTDGPVGGEAA